MREINTLGITQNIDRFFPNYKDERKTNETRRKRRASKTNKRCSRFFHYIFHLLSRTSD